MSRECSTDDEDCDGGGITFEADPYLEQVYDEQEMRFWCQKHLSERRWQV